MSDSAWAHFEPENEHGLCQSLFPEIESRIVSIFQDRCFSNSHQRFCRTLLDDISMGKQNDTTIQIRYATCECIRFRSFNKDKLFAASGGELTPNEIRKWHCYLSE